MVGPLIWDEVCVGSSPAESAKREVTKVLSIRRERWIREFDSPLLDKMAPEFADVIGGLSIPVGVGLSPIGAAK